VELVKVKIENFLSIKKEETIKVNNTITTLIGLNESGKTTLLKAIEKLNGSAITKNEKNKNLKNKPSHIIGVFLLNEDEVKEINSISNNKVLIFPDGNFYIEVEVKDADSIKYYSISKKIDKKSENFDFEEIIKENLITYTDKLFNELGENKLENFNSTIKKTEFKNLANVYTSLISQYQSKDIGKQLTSLTNELNDDGWIKLIPEFKIVKFSSSDDILSDEVDIETLKNNIQVKNLLKIANINADELIENIQSDNMEELKTYEGQYKSNITKMFKKIFSQNDTNFNFQIGIDTKNNKIYFYTFDKTSGDSPIPLKNRSDGFKWYFSIYITLYEYLQRDDDIKYILLFDEPNLYLNPSAQYDLLERVFKQEFKNEQIVYTTHNPYMIDVDNFSSIRIVEKTDCSRFYNTTVDYFKKHKQVTNEVDPMTPILTALNIDISNSLILDRNKSVIVVEGIEDIYILQSMIKKLNRTEDFKNINFIPCFGASKIPTMYGYVYGMGYNVFALTDNDKDGLDALYEIIGSEMEDSVLYSSLMTYNMTIDKNVNKCLEDLFTDKILFSQLTPKNTVIYRNFMDNIDKITLDNETKNNFNNLFDGILKVMEERSNG
jgi:hypothetical protein